MAALNKLLRPTLIKAATLYATPITAGDRTLKKLRTSVCMLPLKHDNFNCTFV